MPRSPVISPLDGPAELAARRILATALIDSLWRISSWHDADRQAADVLDRLKADGYELVAVAWT